MFGAVLEDILIYPPFPTPAELTKRLVIASWGALWDSRETTPGVGVGAAAARREESLESSQERGRVNS